MVNHATPDALRTLEIPVRGMDCTECTQHVQHALCALPGVQDAEVFLSSEKAVVHYDPAQVDRGPYAVPSRLLATPFPCASLNFPSRAWIAPNVPSMCSTLLPLSLAWKPSKSF